LTFETTRFLAVIALMSAFLFAVLTVGGAFAVSSQVRILLGSGLGGAVLVVVAVLARKREPFEQPRVREGRTGPKQKASDPELESLALSAFEELPETFRDRITNLAFVVEEEPPEGKAWLATYEGTPLSRQSVFRGWTRPHKITLYRGPIRRLCGNDPERLEDEVRHIIRHEIAHYFGITDKRLVEIDRY
jgi:predicted Zn-dependent protease with MMP-like domain